MSIYVCLCALVISFDFGSSFSLSLSLCVSLSVCYRQTARIFSYANMLFFMHSLYSSVSDCCCRTFSLCALLPFVASLLLFSAEQTFQCGAFERSCMLDFFFSRTLFRLVFFFAVGIYVLHRRCRLLLTQNVW